MKNKVLKNISPYFKKYLYIGIPGYILMLVAAAFSLILPLIIQEVVNDFSALSIGMVLSIVGLILGNFIFQSISTYLLALMGNKVTLDIREEYWSTTLSGKIEDLDTIQSGEISSRLISDTLNVASFVSTQLPNMVTGIISLLGSFAIMMYLDITLTIAMIVLVPILLLTILPISNKVAAIAETQQTFLGEGNSYFTERISQIRLIKAYGTEAVECEQGRKELRKMYRLDNKGAKITAFLTPLIGGILTVLLISIVGIGLYRVNKGIITAGTIVAFFLYFYETLNPVQTIAGFIVEVKELNGSTKQLFRLLRREKEEYDGQDDGMEQGGISFHGVSFGYEDNQEILKNVSFSAGEGEQTAIVGESGSGKTTIISLLERFYSLNEGVIYYGNTPINKIALGKWRALFSYVAQESIIISGTVRENIIYGSNRNVSDEELLEAAKIADIYDFVMQQPNGFNTNVGERGIHLSGGQKQRIAIARAIIRKPKYLLLDEATANLDSATEENVQKSINTLLKGRSSIVIAHRLSTIINADCVIVLQNGKVTGQGTHQELLENNHYYAELVKSQSFV